jgi:hypothetical protein
MSALPPALAIPGSLLAKQGGGQHQHPIGPRSRVIAENALWYSVALRTASRAGPRGWV